MARQEITHSPRLYQAGETVFNRRTLANAGSRTADRRGWGRQPGMGNPTDPVSFSQLREGERETLAFVGESVAARKRVDVLTEAHGRKAGQFRDVGVPMIGGESPKPCRSRIEGPTRCEGGASVKWKVRE